MKTFFFDNSFGVDQTEGLPINFAKLLQVLLVLALIPEGDIFFDEHAWGPAIGQQGIIPEEGVLSVGDLLVVLFDVFYHFL